MRLTVGLKFGGVSKIKIVANLQRTQYGINKSAWRWSRETYFLVFWFQKCQGRNDAFKRNWALQNKWNKLINNLFFNCLKIGKPPILIFVPKAMTSSMRKPTVFWKSWCVNVEPYKPNTFSMAIFHSGSESMRTPSMSKMTASKSESKGWLFVWIGIQANCFDATLAHFFYNQFVAVNLDLITFNGEALQFGQYETCEGVIRFRFR